MSGGLSLQDSHVSREPMFDSIQPSLIDVRNAWSSFEYVKYFLQSSALDPVGWPDGEMRLAMHHIHTAIEAHTDFEIGDTLFGDCDGRHMRCCDE